MKILTSVLALSVLMFACRPVKKVQKIQEAISKVDTTSVTINTNKVDKVVDSSLLIKDVFQKVTKNRIDFKTFSAKVHVTYSGPNKEDEFTAYIRLEKDKVVWLSLRGPLGIEGFRVLITRDSVKLMDIQKKTIQYRSIGYLQNITELPFDFKTLQDFIVGNPVFVDSNIATYRKTANNELQVLMVGKVFKHLVTLDNSDYKVLHSKLDDIDVVRNRTCDITFSDYSNTSGKPFSTTRQISVAEKSKLDIGLNFKQYSFDEPTTFPFTVPKNYSKK